MCSLGSKEAAADQPRLSVTLAEFAHVWPASKDEVSVAEAVQLLRELLAQCTEAEIRKAVLSGARSSALSRKDVLKMLVSFQNVDLSQVKVCEGLWVQSC